MDCPSHLEDARTIRKTITSPEGSKPSLTPAVPEGERDLRGDWSQEGVLVLTVLLAILALLPALHSMGHAKVILHYHWGSKTQAVTISVAAAYETMAGFL